ncbi:MAG: c-type cytochrome [Gammaproteobacteria bacterium]|nr:c-type cytochrome [Gammaproteobacteria bacterium]MDH4313963.1 c-type cytochrome [Gammaproteobacteria bacterium]MDH5212696.1 c-type cytochrome [Gammaproteobacteria bacterium]
MTRTQVLSAFIISVLASHLLTAEEAVDEYASVRSVINTCEVCHGVSGASTLQQYPILAGQEFYYIYVQLKDFQSGLREGPIMGPLVSGLDKETMQLLAKYFSEGSWPETDYAADEQQTRSGRTVIAAGQCVACHLGAFHGNSRIPRLAGQHAEYLSKTMLDFKSRSRNNAPDKGSLMATFSDEQISDVAQYLSALRE